MATSQQVEVGQAEKSIQELPQLADPVATHEELAHTEEEEDEAIGVKNDQVKEKSPAETVEEDDEDEELWPAAEHYHSPVSGEDTEEVAPVSTAFDDEDDEKDNGDDEDDEEDIV
ncbi:hypothetical protein LINPERPRIM_LOCUS13490 [Linum perenne]